MCQSSGMKQQMKRPEGVRETKRREMHRRITETGLRLFAEHGYESTTLDTIAEASGIARRTFFHYFGSKEDIVLAWQAALPDALRGQILDQHRGRSPLATIEAAVVALAASMQPDIAITIARLVNANAQLQYSNQAKFLQMEQSAWEALCDLWPDTTRHDGLRQIAMLGMGALRLAINAWVADGAHTLLSQYIERNFAGLRAELHAAEANGSNEMPA